MNYADIQQALETLRTLAWQFQETMEETEGEYTPEAEQLDAQKEAVRELLTTEGVDSLGRWLKSVEDSKAAFKAEKAAADRRIKSADKTIEFIKQTIRTVLTETGQDKVKGAFYSFAQYDSVKSSCDTEAIDARWLEAATDAARDAGLPSWCDIVIKPSTTRLKEWMETNAEDGEFLQQEVTPTVKFTKPRASKE